MGEWERTGDPWYDRGQLILLEWLVDARAVDPGSIQPNDDWIRFERRDLIDRDTLAQDIRARILASANQMVQVPLPVKLVNHVSEGQAIHVVQTGGVAAPKQVFQIDPWHIDRMKARLQSLENTSGSVTVAEADGDNDEEGSGRAYDHVMDPSEYQDASKAMSRPKPVRKLSRQEARDRGLLKGVLKGLKPGPIGADLALQYIGLRKDLEQVQAEAERFARGFVAELYDGGKGRTKCQVCGMATTNPPKMSQSKNPFYNQTHTTPVRGFVNSASPGSMCHICTMKNLCAALTLSWPYFRADDTFLLVPECGSLEVYRRLGEQCLERRLSKWTDGGQFDRNKNIRTLRGRPIKDPYLAVLYVWHSIRYLLEDDLERSDDALERDDAVRVSGWMVLPFSKGQNVNFAPFTRLTNDNWVYDAVGPFQDRYDRTLNLVGDVLSHYDSSWVNRVARGVVSGSGKDIADGLAEWLREERKVRSEDKPGRESQGRMRAHARRTSRVMGLWLAHYYSRSGIVDEALLKRIRGVGEQLGRSFSDNIGYMTKLANVRTLEDMRAVVSEGLFLLYKHVVSEQADYARKRAEYERRHAEGRRDGNSGNRAGSSASPNPPERVWLGTKAFDEFIGSVSEDNFDSVRNLLVSYAALSAIAAVQRGRDESEKDSTESREGVQ